MAFASRSSASFRAQAVSARRTPMAAVSRKPVVCRANILESIGKAFTQGKGKVTIDAAGVYDVGAVSAKMQQYIADSPCVVFSWTGCPYCKSAKKLLDDVGATYTAVELDTMDDGKALRAELYKFTDRTSVPNVFIAGKSWGGMTDGPGINALNSKGELVPLLKAAGAL